MTKLITLLIFISAPYVAFASDPITCLKNATRDKTFLSWVHENSRRDYFQSGEEKAEMVFVRLCKRATESFDPIACVKTAVADPEVLAANKAEAKFNKRDIVKSAEAAALVLCGQ